MLRPMEAGIRGSWHYQFFFFLLRQCYWRSIFFFPKVPLKRRYRFSHNSVLGNFALFWWPVSWEGALLIARTFPLLFASLFISSGGRGLLLCPPLLYRSCGISHAQPGLHLPRWARHHFVHSGFCYQPKILRSLIWLCSEILSSDVFSVHVQISSRDNTTKWLLYFVVFSGYC